MSSILLVNQGHTNNIGDIAINKSIMDFLSSRCGGVLDFPFCDEVGAFGGIYKILPKRIQNKLLRTSAVVDFLNHKRISSYVTKADISVAIIGGGELCMNHPGFASSMKCWLSVLDEHKIPAIIYGISVSSDIPDDLREKYCYALHKAKKVIVRDKSSLDYLKNQFGIDAMLFPDPVFSLDLGFERTDKADSDTMLFIPVPYCGSMKSTLGVSNDSEYLEWLHKFLQSSVERFSPREIVFTTTASQDDGFVKNVYSSLSNRLDTDCSYKSVASIEEYISLAKGASAIISGRMHAMILGMKCGCGIVPIPYKEKLISFQKEYATGSIDINLIEKNATEGLEYLLNRL